MNTNLYRSFLLAIIATFVMSACGGEQSPKNPDTVESQMEQYVPPTPMNKSEIKAKGARSLTNDEISNLVVGKMITIKHLPTGNELTGYYNEDGTRTMIEFDKGVAIQGGQTTGASRDPYHIEGNQLHAVFEGKQISTTIYQLENRYLAAVSDQNGMVNYEVIPPGRKNKK